MLSVEDLSSSTSTMSENVSRAVFLEIITNKDWVCYSTTAQPDTLKLIKRFLTIHAYVPGGISSQMFAVVPIGVFRFEGAEKSLYEGYLFSNGAVIHLRINGDDAWDLFIDSDTYTTWGYPKDTLQYRGRQGSNPSQ